MKKIIICCDGTGNEYGENNTNVVEAYAICSGIDGQVAFYDPGVGTGGWEYHEGKPAKDSLRAINDRITGDGLQKNVNDAYAFLMRTYETGDEIYLFGFSRGAFTVRTLAGMLARVGLLAAENENLVEFAAKLYNTKDNAEIARGFKKTFSRACPVHFIGVWDTVESLATNARKRWHDSTLNSEVSHGYQALAIDEQRKDFPPSLWDEATLSSNQSVQQVWFSGVHSNIGGWYDDRGLSNITLHWMLGKAKDCGLQINQALLNQRQRDPTGDLPDSRSGFWNFRGKYIRPVPKGSHVHKSVFERIDGPVKYDPKNVLDRSEYKIVG